MYTKSLKTSSSLSVVRQKWQDYMLLFKSRLSFTVVFSSVMAYAIATVGNFHSASLAWLFLGGFLITAASNAINQILEKDYDRLMKRTQNRPLATNRMTITEAVLIAGITGVSGILILWYFFNPMAALLGAISLLLYAFVYTPMKRLTPFAVLVGAIPGAMPPLIGWVCATGTLGFEATVLYSIQFLWQFPHFWAIAWIAHEDYSKAGFKLLPATKDQGKFTALLSVLYTLILIPVSIIPMITGFIGIGAGIVVLISGILFFLQAVSLLRDRSQQNAKKLMFASIIYLPVVLIALLAGRIML